MKRKKYQYVVVVRCDPLVRFPDRSGLESHALEMKRCRYTGRSFLTLPEARALADRVKASHPREQPKVFRVERVL